ncbi:MAG: GspE/PulE family protein [Gammaproteobacteria bacterium]
MAEPVLRSTRAAEHRLDLQQVLDWLVTDGLLASADATRMQADARWRGPQDLHPLVVVANQKLDSRKPPHHLLSLESLTQWLAHKADLPYRHIDPLQINVAAVSGLVSYAYAYRYRILPVGVTPQAITFATAEPFLREWIGDLRNLLRKDIQRVVANPLDINRYLLEFYGLSRSVAGATAASGQATSNLFNFEQLLELGKGGEIGAEEKPVVQIVDWLLQYAFEQRASDIHLEPRRDRGFVRFRIDGVLHRVYEMPPAVMAAVTSRVKILGRMDVAERRRPQDGRIKTRSPAGREVELRLSTMPTAFGEKCVLRIFDPDIAVKSFGHLGFSPSEIETWKAMVERPHGIILVTGPTGSGKTTTLYSTLKYLARPEVNVCTVEDPIEMVVPDFNQMQVQPAIELGFAQGVRTLLRQDPDIIMVGEIRDLDTAQMAIQASLTGHLVLSTLHTNDAAAAVTRMLDLGVPAYLIQGTLVGVVAQRLVRTLCPHCKTAGAVNDALWATLVHPWRIDKPKTVSAPQGCLECRSTGYLGRTAIYEMLTVTPEVRALLRQQPDSAQLRRVACQEGMRPLRLGGAYHIATGLTTVEEVLQVVPPTEA